MTLPGYAFRVGEGQEHDAGKKGGSKSASYLPSSTTANRAETKITVAKTPTTVNIIRLATPNLSATRPTRPSVRPSSQPGRGKLLPHPLNVFCQKNRRFCGSSADGRSRVGN